jgi:hypothetical protein
MGNVFNKKKKNKKNEGKEKENEERRKIAVTLNHRLTFAAAYFQKTADIFSQVVQKKFQSFQKKNGFSDNQLEEFHHHCKLFCGESVDLSVIFLNCSSITSNFNSCKIQFDDENLDKYSDKCVDDIYNYLYEIMINREISIGMRNVFDKLSNAIWKKLFVDNHQDGNQTFEQRFSSWEKSCITIEEEKLTFERAKAICEYLLMQPVNDNSKFSNHILIIYTWQVWQIIDSIKQLFPTLDEYCQTSFLKLQQLVKLSSSSSSLFHGDISLKQFIIFTDNYLPTDICKIILSYDLLQPESSDIFFKNLLEKG